VHVSPILSLYIGIAAGKGKGAIFRNGQVVRVVDEADYLSALVEEGQKLIAEKGAG